MLDINSGISEKLLQFQNYVFSIFIPRQLAALPYPLYQYGYSDRTLL